MAPLTYLDIQDPDGWLVQSQHFPKDSTVQFQARLDKYLAQAYADVRVVALPTEEEQNNAARAFAYYRAADAIIKRMTAIEWSAQKQGEGGKSQSKEQLDEWIKARDQYLAEFDAAVADPEEIPPTKVQPTTSIGTDVLWG